ncbi:MAG: hypothetical protein RR334_03685, partial [Clostridia bacterium]
ARAENNRNLLNLIVAETFVRHSKLTEGEYLKKIGFDKTNKTEDEAVRISMFNVLLETTKELIKAKGIFNMANNLMKVYLLDQGIEEKDIEKVDDSNGK